MQQPFIPLSPDLSIDVQKMASLGSSVQESYGSAQPFPYIKIDDFLPEDLLEGVLSDLRSLPRSEASFDRSQERLKSSYPPNELPAHTRNLFWFMNSRPFLAFLENMTGIKGLIPDPYYLGGGIHEVKNGGHLDIHADFNHLAKLNLERRLNLLIYLNRDWQPEYGGQFEIWDKEMKHRVKDFDPVFNRCVVFNTSSDSYHGNPNSVQHPQNKSRFSMALYYYTATWDGTRRQHTTQFKVRPGSKDAQDWEVRVSEALADVTPPVLFRLGKKVINRSRRLLGSAQ
jgi:hypothetical protein